MFTHIRGGRSKPPDGAVANISHAAATGGGRVLSDCRDGLVRDEDSPAQRPLAAHSLALHEYRIRVTNVVQDDAPPANFPLSGPLRAPSPGDDSAADLAGREPPLDLLDKIRVARGLRRDAMRVQRRPWPQRPFASRSHRKPGADVQCGFRSISWHRPRRTPATAGRAWHGAPAAPILPRRVRIAADARQRRALGSEPRQAAHDFAP